MSRDIRDLFARMAATPERALPPKPHPVANPKADPSPRAKDPKTKKRPTKPKVSKPPLPHLLPASDDFTFVDSTRASHRDEPPHLGRVRVPTGASGCLQGLTFAVTGTLDSITRDTLKEIIEKYGGRLTKSVTGQTDIVIRGVRDVGPSKLQTALDRHIPVIDERGLFHIIRESSGQLEDEDELSAPEPDLRPPPRPDVPPTNVPALALPEPESQPSSSPLEPTSEPSAVIPPVPLFDAPLPQVVDPASLLLTERYRPQRLDELVGNQRQIEALQKWLRGFDKQDKKAVLISGPPGIGKSTAATLVAELAGYHVIEFNASDTRSKSAMESHTQDLFSSKTIVRFGTGHSSSTRTCVVFDEIDGMSSGDRGGLATLAQFISRSRVPVICICNDRYSTKLEGLTGKLAIDLPFEAPTEMEVLQRLNTICKAEGIVLGRTQYFGLARQAAGDLRSALNGLHFWSESVGSASEKDAQKCDPLAAAKDLLKPATGFERRMDDFFVDYDIVPEFVHDNLMFTEDFDGWQLALDSMARGHEVSQTMRELSMFDLLPAVAISSSILPAALVPQTRTAGQSRQFVPECFGRMSKTNKNYRILTEIAAKCSRNCFVPRSTFRDGVAELLTFRCYEMLARGDEAALVAYLGAFEMTKDDMVELRDTVDFGLKTFPEVKVGASFTRLFNASHSASPKSGDSLESQRADYFITAKKQEKQTRAKKKG